MANIIIAIFWFICSLLVMVQYAPFCKDLSNRDYFLVGFIFIIGGPFFVIVNVLEALLYMILPEGWDNQNGL